MSYGKAIREEFAKTYARVGNAAHALRIVLGEERAGKMQPHTLRAKASELLNHYLVVKQIEQHKAEMIKRGETLPHFRGRTVRNDLMAADDKPIELPARPFVIPWGMKGLFKQMERIKRSATKTAINAQ